MPVPPPPPKVKPPPEAKDLPPSPSPSAVSDEKEAKEPKDKCIYVFGKGIHEGERCSKNASKKYDMKFCSKAHSEQYANQMLVAAQKQAKASTVEAQIDGPAPARPKPSLREPLKPLSEKKMKELIKQEVKNQVEDEEDMMFGGMMPEDMSPDEMPPPNVAPVTGPLSAPPPQRAPVYDGKAQQPPPQQVTVTAEDLKDPMHPGWRKGIIAFYTDNPYLLHYKSENERPPEMTDKEWFEELQTHHRARGVAVMLANVAGRVGMVIEPIGARFGLELDDLGKNIQTNPDIIEGLRDMKTEMLNSWGQIPPSYRVAFGLVMCIVGTHAENKKTRLLKEENARLRASLQPNIVANFNPSAAQQS